MRAIGLMSGTSMDGIDVALIETDGETVSRFGPSAVHVYRDEEAALLRQAVEAERMTTALHAAVVRGFLDANAIDPASVDVIGFHGQTILHRPEDRLTVQ